jgi:hypothetical protein
VAAVVVIWIGTSVLRNALAPPATVGKTPGEVVELFYTSINTLDNTTMEDCLDRKLDIAEVRETLHLYVISKVRMAYEGTSGFYSAQEWVDNGRPPLEGTEMIYGIAELEINREMEDTYRVTYEKWITSSGDDPEADSASLKLVGTLHADRVFLRDTGKYWVIYRIDRLKEEPIPNGQ